MQNFIRDLQNDTDGRLEKMGIQEYAKEYFPRELLIDCFLTALNDVLEKNEESIYFCHFQLSTSINSVYRTILLP